MHLIVTLLNFLTPYGFYAYFVMLGILLACGFGLPMPEDIVLVTGGVLSARGVTDFWVTVLICMFGVLAGDGMIFFLGRARGVKIKEWKLFRSLFTEAREKKIASWFEKHGEKVIFLARFAPGLRMPLFLSAGIYQVAPWKFFALDGFAALISVPAWIWAGHFFGSNLEVLEEHVHQMQLGIYSILGGGILLTVLILFIKKKLMPMP